MRRARGAPEERQEEIRTREECEREEERRKREEVEEERLREVRERESRVQEVQEAGGTRMAREKNQSARGA